MAVVVSAGDAGEPGKSDQLRSEHFATRDVARLRACRNQDPQPPGTDHELQRRTEGQRLTVEAAKDGCVRFQQQAVGLPMAHSRTGTAVRRSALPGRTDPQHPAVEAETSPVIGCSRKHVRVVRHHRHRRPLGLLSIRGREPDRSAAVLTGAHLPHHLGDGALLVLPVLVAVHRLGVHPEADIVEERPVTSEAVIDENLVTVANRVERGQRVVPIESEVEAEVVARPDRDTEERHITLDGNARHQPERAVTAGRADRVGAGVDGVARELSDVVAAFEHDHSDAGLAGGVGQPELLGLAVAAPAVDNQGGMRNTRPAPDVRRRPRGERKQLAAHEDGDHRRPGRHPDREGHQPSTPDGFGSDGGTFCDLHSEDTN